MHNHLPHGPPAQQQQQQHPSYDDKSSRRQSWHEGSQQNGNNKLPSIRTIWTQEENDHHRPPYSPNNFNTSYLRSPVSSKDEPRRHRGAFSPVSRRQSLPSQSRPAIELKNHFERTPEEDEDYPMRNGFHDGHDPNTPSSVDDESMMMDIDSKKITSIADLCHPDRARTDRNRQSVGANSGMDLLSQAAAALIDQ
jgi:hypothetical protein